MERDKGQGRPDVPKSRETTFPKGHGGEQKESKERQPLPNVWDVLERELRFDALPFKRIREEFQEEFCEVFKLVREIELNGPRRDRGIVDLYMCEKSKRPLSREEFQQFRSKIESLSDDEIADKLSRRREQAVREFELERRNFWKVTEKLLNINRPARK